MYVDSCTYTRCGRTYTRHLLRESFREEGKVRHRTIANISSCTEEEIQAIRLALRYKGDLEVLGAVSESIELQQGPSIGPVWLLFQVALEMGIVGALGHSRAGKLALWQVMARVIDQGSRLSAVRLAGTHAACDILGIDDTFHEDHLYANLDWLAENQPKIENRLFRKLHPGAPPQFYLYDVTSTYLEGACNALAAFGYNRDGKKGKRQLVIGLLCDEAGVPLTIEVFRGNTSDPKTVASQVQKLADRFGGGEVTFVGDRGMLKSQQIEDVLEHGFHYLTAITKPQIEKLLAQGAIQMGLFDQVLAEVVTGEGIRYILRRNPVRAAELETSREDKLCSLRGFVEHQNTYLAEHSRAQAEVALRKVNQRCARLRLDRFVSAQATDRILTLSVDESARAEAARLDGCYVLKTDLGVEVAGMEELHDRYKDLALVEWAFRTCKTVDLEMRPVNVRLKSRTRGHALVVMLGYRLVQELANRWADLDVTVEEGIDRLCTLCATEVRVDNHRPFNRIPSPSESNRALLDAAGVRLPEVLPSRGVTVATRKKLPSNRLSR